ncbi:MAG: PqqD family peptide modification chaperone, partial [Proteobacteria bacterium]|nr:PqqD family peptide modification chaperone [Pseudomonadota bacterium]
MHNVTNVPHRIKYEDDIAVGEPAVLRLPSGIILRLNGPAALVWQCIDGNKDIDQIVQDIQQTFPESYHSIPAHVTDLITNLVAHGLVELAPSARYRVIDPTQMPPGVLFLANHGGAINEASLMYHAAGVPLWLAGPLLRDTLPNVLLPEQVDLYHGREVEIAYTIGEIRKLIEDGKIGIVLFVVPEDTQQIQSVLGDIPLILRHSTGDNERLKGSAPYSFMSPSASAIDFVSAPNQWKSVKCADFRRLDSMREGDGVPISQRRGFFTFINHFQRFTDSYATYLALREAVADLDLRHYGDGSSFGVRNAYEALMGARATVHIKDDGVCCNAVIESISVGVPVIMDRKSCQILGLDHYVVHGQSGLLFDTVAEGAEILRRLDKDDKYLAKLSERTLALARQRCQLGSIDIKEFKGFLNRALDSTCLRGVNPGHPEKSAMAGRQHSPDPWERVFFLHPSGTKPEIRNPSYPF